MEGKPLFGHEKECSIENLALYRDNAGQSNRIPIILKSNSITDEKPSYVRQIMFLPQKNSKPT